MSTYNLVITATVFIPFTVLVLYYFQSIMRRTFHDVEELTTWRDWLYFAGLLFLQIVIAIIFAILTWVVVETKLGL
jgi:hypothetical protein